MSIQGRILAAFGKRNNSISNPNNWLARLVSSGASSGLTVNADTALKVSAVYACIRVLSETLASLPVMLYKRDGEGRKVATDHKLYSLLHDAPNRFQTSFEFRECLVANLNLRGNSYAQKVEKGGYVRELIPLCADQMIVERKNGKIIYIYRHDDGNEERFPEEKIWHVKNMPIKSIYTASAPDGILGLSPISAAKETIGMALAADEYGARFFANNASVGLALSHPGKLAENAKKFLKDSLAEYGKMENKFKSLILEEGLKAEKLGLSNEDSQFLQSRQFQVEEIARIFRIPLMLIQSNQNTPTYASAEQFMLSFVMHTIRPWCVRLEQSMNKYLIPERERGEYFYEHNINGLLRGDAVSRFGAYATARQWGWLNVDEIRAFENMNPLPDDKGKEYLQPLNMVPVGTDLNDPQKETPQAPRNEDDIEDSPPVRQKKIAFVRDHQGRIQGADIITEYKELEEQKVFQIIGKGG